MTRLLGKPKEKVKEEEVQVKKDENENEDEDEDEAEDEESDDFVSDDECSNKSRKRALEASPKQSSKPEKMFYGAILADEMGLGKTIMTLGAVFALCKQLKAKALIVCPSSLVGNWEKECKKWLLTKLNPLVLKPGVEANPVIQNFKNSRGPQFCVMIISYEMLRKHISKINEVTELQVIACDEGHRLKNVDGNQTIAALMQCKAKRRIILSGTPIQNDLDELYSIVDFVVPGWLGSLSTYRHGLSQKIMRGLEPTASRREREEGQRASRKLRESLSQIMLRRTQDEISSKYLPPRTDVVVLVSLSKQQQGRYIETARSILGSIGVSSECLGEMDEAEEDNSVLGGGAGVVLPGLQKLRRICNADCESDSDDDEGEGALSSSSASSSSSSSASASASSSSFKIGNKGSSSKSKGGMTTTRPPVALATILAGSHKLMLLKAMLEVLRSRFPNEKAVVVSNFLSTLNQVALLAQECGWGCLRIDGSVASGERQNLVDCFNREGDPRFLFLLSSKAGGVGINLIGGSRLFMMDCDWNPAVDAQAMSRVWRDGQKKPVFVYRLVAANRIEEVILKRQKSKGSMADDVMEEEDVQKKKGKGKRGPSLTKKDIVDLISPSVNVTASAAGSSSPQSSSKLNSKDILLEEALKKLEEQGGGASEVSASVSFDV